MVSEELERAFFEDIARAEDDAEDSARTGLSGDSDVLGGEYDESFRALQVCLGTPEAIEAFAHVVSGVVHGAIHSVMVTLDGGSQSAEHEDGPFRLVDARGEPARSGLHEGDVDHLFDTGRRR